MVNGKMPDFFENIVPMIQSLYSRDAPVKIRVCKSIDKIWAATVRSMPPMLNNRLRFQTHLALPELIFLVNVIELLD